MLNWHPLGTNFSPHWKVQVGKYTRLMDAMGYQSTVALFFSVRCLCQLRKSCGSEAPWHVSNMLSLGLRKKNGKLEKHNRILLGQWLNLKLFLELHRFSRQNKSNPFFLSGSIGYVRNLGGDCDYFLRWNMNHFLLRIWVSLYFCSYFYPKQNDLWESETFLHGYVSSLLVQSCWSLFSLPCQEKLCFPCLGTPHVIAPTPPPPRKFVFTCFCHYKFWMLQFRGIVFGFKQSN